MPRALVTDTLLPYPDSTTCYAEFTTVSTLFNAQRTIAFKYFLDTDSLASLGWIETFEWWTGLWRPIDGALDIEFTASHVTPTDSTPVFTGRSLGWDSLSFSFGCNKQGVPDTVRFRFAFRSTSNPSLRDGWMIDNVMHTSFNCMGSVGENEFLATKVVPNPTSDEVNIYIALPVSAQYKMQLFRGDGALILEVERNYSGSQILDLTSLPNGPYLLQIIAEGKHATERIILQH